MAVFPVYPEMTQSRQNYTLGLGTRGATPDLPLAHPRPTKPLPTARSNASSRSSDKVANAVYNNGQSTHSSYSMPVAAKSTHHLSSRPESRPSASSAAIGGRSHDRHYGSADFEKGLQGLDQSRLLSTEYPSVARAASPMQSLHHFQTGGHSANVDHLISTYAHEGYESDSVEDKAMQILIHLSVSSPFVTFAISIYTLLIQLFLILMSPLRLCTTRRTFSQEIIQYLTPPLKLQLQLIHSPIGQSGGECSASSLSLTHLLSPVVSAGVAVAAWVAAVFWFYAAILGDPDGKGGGNDGRATVLSVRGWWEAWLGRPMKR